MSAEQVDYGTYEAALAKTGSLNRMQSNQEAYAPDR